MEFARGLLLQPERLRDGLKKCVEREREQVLRGDPEQEASSWLEKTTAVDRQRAKYQEMAAEELITFEELREQLAGLEETKKTAQGELQSISLRRQRLEELERSADDLVRQYTAIMPEALDTISPEERHQIYKTLRMKVLVSTEGTVTVELDCGHAPDSGSGSVNVKDLWKNVSPSHNIHTGTDYSWSSERTVVSQAVSSSRSLLSHASRPRRRTSRLLFPLVFSAGSLPDR
jgi:hypothetical protein